MKMRALIPSIILTLVIGFVATTGYAQTSAQNKEATIKGMVVNATTGSPIADVEVSLKDTDMSATTDSTGHFSIEGVQPGKYVVTVQDMGYKEYEQSVEVSSSDVELTIKLEPESGN